jgi:hypothetical protein
MKSEAIGCALAVLLLPVIAAVAARADTFCIAQDAWTCNGTHWIEVLEQLDRQGAKVTGSAAAKESFRLRGLTGCQDYPWLPDEGRNLVDNRITVMYVRKNDAFFCQKFTGLDKDEPQRVDFACSNVLISDIRDSSWHHVSREQLDSVAAKTTMRDVAEHGFCPADYPK